MSPEWRRTGPCCSGGGLAGGLELVDDDRGNAVTTVLLSFKVTVKLFQIDSQARVISGVGALGL